MRPPPSKQAASRGTRTHVEGVLHLYHRPASLVHRDASTVMEHVNSFSRYSRFPVWALNTQLGVPNALWRLRFAAVVLHYSLFAPDSYHLNQEFRSYLAEECQSSYKVAFFQDEYHFCRNRFEFLNEHGIDCVYSCLEPEQFDAVYGRYTGVARVVSNVPGYVSREMIEAGRRLWRPDEERHIDVGYRGRRLPPYFGRGALEKYEIGAGFLERAGELGLKLDIASEESDRIYGKDWYRFIADCRAVLGTESGVSVFDLEDEVYAEYKRLKEHGEVSIEQLERGPLGRWEGRIPYRTISPRHFEAAALRVCQILYEGQYSGAMEPMVHYIPLKKDFSNFDEAIERFLDPKIRMELTENAHRDLVRSGAYSYETFMAGFDETLIGAGLQARMSVEQRRRVEASLRKGTVGRRLRSQLWDLHDDLRARDIPGKDLLRPLATPALRLVDRRRRGGPS